MHGSIAMLSLRLRHSNSNRMPGPLSLMLLLFIIAPTALRAQSDKFEPYQLNGGLLAAVAAKDFVVVASDTRFMGPGGYDIVTRRHISSRLWMAADDTWSISPSSLPENNQQKTEATEAAASIMPGSITKIQSFVTARGSPTFIGSSGCSTDCEALKRSIQADLRSAVYFAECSTSTTGISPPPVDQVANLLSQMLFSRRAMPFYSFCVVAGLSPKSGRVYVYDAIGSYEEVAVATAGTGRDLLQPILDGKFRTVAASVPTEQPLMTRTSTVPTQVDCTEEEAISILIEGYRSVSEREIGVGDNLVLCVLKRRAREEGVRCNIYSVPLKKH